MRIKHVMGNCGRRKDSRKHVYSKREGEIAIIMGEIKRMLRCKDHSLAMILCKKMYYIDFSKNVLV